MEDKSNGKSIIKNTFFKGYQINYNHNKPQRKPPTSVVGRNLPIYFGDKFKGEGIEISPNKIEKLKKQEKY